MATAPALEDLIDHVDAVVWEAWAHPEVEFTYVSRAAERILGYPAAGFCADRGFWPAHIHPEDRAEAARFCAEAIARREHHTFEYRWLAPGGRVVWVRDVVRVHDGDPLLLRGLMLDVTELRESEARSRRAQALFEAAFAQAPLGMGLTSLEPESVDELVEVNDALCALLGRSREELLSTRMDDFTHPEDRGRAVALKERMLRGELPGFYAEKRYVRADGSVVWGGLHGSLVRDADGRPVHGLGQLEDISDRRASAQELAHRALHDGLTGLPNRQLFMDRLEHALAQRRRQPVEHVAVLFVDVDDLKTVNDSFGHSAGDAVIRQVGARLRAAVRPGDTIARLGGDEFTVLCPAIPAPGAAVTLAERLLSALEAPIDAEGHRVAARASIGIALGEPGAEVSAEGLLGEADEALLRAKELGKQRVQLFDAQLRSRAQTRRHSAADLRRALEREELTLHYQPIVDLRTGAIRGAEALVRWQHPERGLLPPGDFIPLAERLGVIVDIGRWVVARACRDWQGWPRAQQADRLWLALNLSSRELAEPRLASDLAAIVAEHGGDPTLMSFEITETSIVAEPEGAVRAMRALQELGVMVAIDDFGKGHSSLAQLKSFPVDVLKLDHLFVRGIERTERDAALVAAVVAMARALDVHLIAEGIEERGQRDRLVVLGCRWGQGFHFARPMPAEQIAALLRSGKNIQP